MKSRNSHILPALAATALAGFAWPAAAGPVPAQLPDPDGKPGAADKPVQVYILAGQSNMVGMGEIQGAKNLYTGVYLDQRSRRARRAADHL